jgi:hypothetical protein
MKKLRESGHPEAKYHPRRCRFFNVDVWAILTRGASGRWCVANCLDKHAGCMSLNCAFTADGGEWPFAKEGRSHE